MDVQCYSFINKDGFGIYNWDNVSSENNFMFEFLRNA